jgi:hypothetical protein
LEGAWLEFTKNFESEQATAVRTLTGSCAHADAASKQELDEVAMLSLAGFSSNSRTQCKQNNIWHLLHAVIMIACRLRAMLEL